MEPDDREAKLQAETMPGASVRPPSAPLPLWPGQVLLDRYEVERVLGVGGMGIVVSAMHLELGERVALKAMLPEVAANRDHATRFAREAKAAARIKSEFVARVIDVAKLPDGSPFMVMEYLEGIPLSSHLEQRGALPVDLAVDLLLQAGSALAEAHRLGIVHRDVKPANLFLARQDGGGEILKVLDFGISKSDENMTITRTSGAIGTPSYMSPEQLRAAGSVRATADIWSLGVVLYEMLTTRLPYEADSFADICALVLVTPPRPPRAFDPSLPEELEAVILRCLEGNPAQRFPSVMELALALEPFASEFGRGLIGRIELLGTSRRSLTSLEETPVSGRPSLASFPHATPRSLQRSSTPSPAPFLERHSAPPSSSIPVARSSTRTPAESSRTLSDPPPTQGARSPGGRRAWVLLAFVGALVVGGAGVFLGRAGEPQRAPAAAGRAESFGAEGDAAPRVTSTAMPRAAGSPLAAAPAAPSPSTSSSTAPSATPPAPTAPSAAAGHKPAGSVAEAPPSGAGAAGQTATATAPAAPTPPKASNPDAFEDFGGRR